MRTPRQAESPRSAAASSARKSLPNSLLTFVLVLFLSSDSAPLELALIHYVALPFTPVDGGLAPGQAVECPHADAAIRRAHAMSRDPVNVGAVAFSRRGDAELGEFEDAVVLKTFGQVPDDLTAPVSGPE